MHLRDYLTAHRIKQTTFAALIGTSQAAVSRYCAGRLPAADQLHAIARATGGQVTAHDFGLAMQAPRAPTLNGAVHEQA